MNTATVQNVKSTNRKAAPAEMPTDDSRTYSLPRCSRAKREMAKLDRMTSPAKKIVR